MIYSLESLVTHSLPLVFLFLLNLLLQQDRNQVFFTYCKHYIYSVVVVEMNSSHMVWLYQKWIFIHGMCMPKLMASRSSQIGYLLCISDNLVNRWQMWCSDESNYAWSCSMYLRYIWIWILIITIRSSSFWNIENSVDHFWGSNCIKYWS